MSVCDPMGRAVDGGVARGVPAGADPNVGGRLGDIDVHAAADEPIGPATQSQHPTAAAV